MFVFVFSGLDIDTCEPTNCLLRDRWYVVIGLYFVSTLQHCCRPIKKGILMDYVPKATRVRATPFIPPWPSTIGAPFAPLRSLQFCTAQPSLSLPPAFTCHSVALSHSWDLNGP